MSESARNFPVVLQETEFVNKDGTKSSISSDYNDLPRANAFKACMQLKGWEQRKKEK